MIAKLPEWSPKSPNWLSKIMPAWRYHQDFAKFPLNHHYNDALIVLGGGVGTSVSERCHLHEDQAQDVLDRPVVEKTATSRAALDAHPSTSPFGVVQRTRKLDYSGMEPGRL
ncbi:hypothetical protein TNCV_1887541 [Trichonephila clavipes]|nr:hypothetical protein TNCV_1887541 [Trichonephila clavipes]